ncbi:MAG: c-type cytochrome [Deltaproteobacteria bacterium]|nr:MAG: c-type cytochrome [Deltaproteobacteria bacterium]
MKSLKAFSSVLFAVGSLLFATSAFAGGPDVFKAENCTKCHSVAAEGIEAAKKPYQRDLSAAGAEHDAAWLAKYIKKEVGIPNKAGEEKMHKGKFNGSDADLGVLTSWLAGLKTPVAPPAE